MAAKRKPPAVLALIWGAVVPTLAQTTYDGSYSATTPWVQNSFTSVAVSLQYPGDYPNSHLDDDSVVDVIGGTQDIASTHFTYSLDSTSGQSHWLAGELSTARKNAGVDKVVVHTRHQPDSSGTDYESWNHPCHLV